jgi:transient receptor potential cation channel subfamily C protein 4
MWSLIFGILFGKLKFTMLPSFVGWIVLRMTAWVIVKREEAIGIDPYYPREEWHAYDPFLISEGLFGAGMISRFIYYLLSSSSTI